MKSKSLLCFALIFAVCFCREIARADTYVYDSVEWMTCMADNIGIYQASQIYGPYAITNHYPAAIQWSDGYCSAEFKLQKALRGHPPQTFSRTRRVEKPEMLGFRAGTTYVFFLVNEERRKNFPGLNLHDSNPEFFFSLWDYIWLDRSQGARNGIALNYRGQLLTNRDEIIETVQDSIKLPRADPRINRWTYFYENRTNFNYAIVSSPCVPSKTEPWMLNMDCQGLVIPKIIATMKPANP